MYVISYWGLLTALDSVLCMNNVLKETRTPGHGLDKLRLRFYLHLWSMDSVYMLYIIISSTFWSCGVMLHRSRSRLWCVHSHDCSVKYSRELMDLCRRLYVVTMLKQKHYAPITQLSLTLKTISKFNLQLSLRYSNNIINRPNNFQQTAVHMHCIGIVEVK